MKYIQTKYVLLSVPQGPVRLPARHAHHRPLWHPPLRQVVVVRKTVVEPRRRGFSEERAVRIFKFRKNNQFTNTACSRPPPAIRTRLCAYAAIGLYAAARHAAAESHWVTRAKYNKCECLLCIFISSSHPASSSSRRPHPLLFADFACARCV